MKNNSNYWSDVFVKEIFPKDINEIKFITKELKKTDKILEAGCGPGKIVFKLLHLKYNGVIGLDFSKDLINFCKKYSKDNNLGKSSNFKEGDIMKIPFDDESFDKYLSFGVIEHFLKNDQKKIIREAYRILKKDGRIFITVPNSYSPNVFQRFLVSNYKKYIVKKPMVYQKNISTKKIRKMFEDEGFKTIKCYNFAFDKAITRFFLLNYNKVFGIKNPFSFNVIKNPIQKITKKLDKYLFKFGETTVYVGVKE